MNRLSLRKIHTLGVISFLTGFALMAYELVAARLLAPTIGSSIYVWTSVIGIIIASLSLGYWLGGKIADARQKPVDVAALCIMAALCVAFTMVSHTGLLEWISQSIEDTRTQGVIASLLLFAPTSFVLGLISPYLAKLNIKELKTAGESVANLSALNSIGGIAGTFITGFVLFSYIGSNETLVIVAVCLLASSWVVVPKEFFIQRLLVSVGILLVMLVPTPLGKDQIARIDSPSAHYDVTRMNYNGADITALSTGPGGIQSAVYTEEKNELVFWYTNYTAQLIEEKAPKKVLILGGGAFTLPDVLAERFPNTTIDVVEIDPALESISKEYFHYEDHENVNLIFQDARAYVNTASQKYGVIFVDVYGDSYVPFSLLTQEYGQQVNSLLEQDGTIIMNAIVGFDEKCQELLAAIDGVYRPYLPNAFWETQTGTEIDRGNYILSYSQNPTPLLKMKRLPTVNDSVFYTDNFMPAERLHYQCAQSV
jgi:predicted membrane-bound spermidine synthase